MAEISRQDWYDDLEPGPEWEGSTAYTGAAPGEPRQSLLLAFLAASLLLLLSSATAYGINHLETRGSLGVADHPLQPWLVPAAYVLLGTMLGLGIRLVGRGCNRSFGIMAVLFTLSAAYLTVVLQRAFGLHELSADFLSGKAAGDLDTIAAIKLAFGQLGPLDWLANQGIADWVALVVAAVASWWLSYAKLKGPQSRAPGTTLAT